MSQVHVLNHPLIQHKLTIMRKVPRNSVSCWKKYPR